MWAVEVGDSHYTSEDSTGNCESWEGGEDLGQANILGGFWWQSGRIMNVLEGDVTRGR